MCIIVYMSHVVDTSQHTTIYPVHYMLPQASRTFPTGDESVFRALTWLLLTLCCFSWSWSHPCCFCCHIINLVTSCIFPILHHMSYHLVIFSSTSIAYTLCLVTSLPSITHHHARKEDHVEKEACEPGTTCSSHQCLHLHHHHCHQLPKRELQSSLPSPHRYQTLHWVSFGSTHFRKGCWKDLKGGTELFKDKDVKQAFHEGEDQGQIMGILAERKEWEAEGHGQWCFNKPPTCLSCNIGLLDGHTCTAKLNTTVQVDFISAQPPSLEAAIQVSPSHHTSSSQTHPPPLLINAEAQPQPIDLAPAATTAPALDSPAFDWSDNAASVPVIPIFPKNQPHHDLSALHTTNPNPFSSLACWNRHHHLPLEDRNISRPTPPF